MKNEMRRDTLTTQAMLSLGRFVVGLGVGVSAVVVPAYVGEMAPPHKRGAVVITYELMLCLGMIASGVADFALKAGFVATCHSFTFYRLPRVTRLFDRYTRVSLVYILSTSTCLTRVHSLDFHVSHSCTFPPLQKTAPFTVVYTRGGARASDITVVRGALKQQGPMKAATDLTACGAGESLDVSA